MLFITCMLVANGHAGENETVEEQVQVTVDGLNDEQTQNLRAFMVIDEETCTAPAWRLRARVKEFKSVVSRALEPLGYFQSTLVSRRLTQVDDCWALSLTIDPGTATVMSEVNLSLSGEGVDSPLFDQAKERLLALEGQVLRSDRYARARDALIVIAAANGFFDAAFAERQLDVYPERHQATLNLAFDTGVQYRLGEVQWLQSEQILDADFVANMLRLDRDGVATTSLLSSIENQLRGTGYFDSVRASYDDTRAEAGRVPLTIRLDPGTRYKYSGGIGYSTDSGPRVRASYANYRVNSMGRQWTSNAQVSAIESEITTAYRLPTIDRPLQRWYSYEAGIQREDSDSVDNESVRVGYSQHRKLGSGWATVFYIDGLHERFTFDDDERSSTLLIPGTLWKRTVSPGLVYPLSGHSVLLEARAASDTLLSDVDLFLIHVSGKKIFGFEASQQRLIVRAELGALATNNFDDVPASLRFFAGGDSSVRGYDFKQIGGLDASGEVIGGEFLFTGSIEWDHRFSDQWGMAVFADMGDAFSDEFDLNTSVGIGARWFSPVGPVRVDLAHPFDDPDTSVRLHVSIGSDL